jgi:hypothetical protein
MKLIIDSKPVAIPAAESQSFQELCSGVMDWLMDQKRSISSCKFDGRLVKTIEEADSIFDSAMLCEIESIPIEIAMQSALALQCNYLGELESRCEKLVTESLLSDPREIIETWRGICDNLKQQISFIPQLGALLTEDQVDELINERMECFNHLMKDAAAALSAADVVQFSDVLELKLIPWLQHYREFLREHLPGN